MKSHLKDLIYLFRLRQCASPKLASTQEDEGLTLIEALVAIVVLTIVLGTIAIPIVITAGSRVQNREVEQAQQIAQSFSEDTRLQMSMLETWTYSGTTPSLSGANPTLSYSPIGAIPPLPTASYSSVSSVPAPTANCGITGPTYSATCTANQLFGYDLDKDGAADFYVQAFRASDIRSANSNEVIGFDMGVRVYPIESINKLGTLTTETRSLGFTSGIGDPTQPIASVYTSVYRGEEADALVSFNSCTVEDFTGVNSASAIGSITNSPADKDTKFSYSLIDNGDGTDQVVTQDPAEGSVVLCGSEIQITY
ncbi:MAG: type II secretion system protein [Prochlorotrichaceae cyanobacterium]